MGLNSKIIKDGNWLFKHRSYMPLFLIPFLFFLINNSNHLLKIKLFKIALLVTLFGQFIRIISIAFVPNDTSGRNTKQQYANTLNTDGIYSIVRHPLYLGNFFIYLGPFIYAGNLYGIIIFVLLFWIYYERIMCAEESYLKNKFNNKYKLWSNKTPAIIPKFKIYKPNNVKFSFIKVLEREYSGIFGIFILFTFLYFVNNYYQHNDIIITIYWKIIICTNLMLYLIVRYFKKINRAKI